MKKALFIFFLVSLFSLSVLAQSSPDSKSTAYQDIPADFKSDGCSMFPDGDYRDCCVEHDKAYFGGGSWTERWRADKKLFKCVVKKEGWWHKPLAPVMWAGVRIGGVPFLPTSFRWGFGRKKEKKIKKPETKEIKNKDEMLKSVARPISN